MPKKIYLIDGYSFLFRAYHSLPPLTNPAGTPVGAVYGFTNMLIKLMNEHRPDYMAVVYDAGKKTFRNDIFEDYKANRPPAPDDLIPQFSLVRDASSALGLQNLELEGYEADDIIATIAGKARASGVEVTIVSSDKDLMQLVDDGAVRMFDAGKSRMIGEAEVLEKFAVAPNRVLDVLSLMGDSADNVPGVPSIGPKTAAELVNMFGDLDAVLERAAEVKQNKRREVLIEYKQQALLSRDLIQLEMNVPLPFEFDDFAVDKKRELGLLEFCRKHGFRSLADKILKDLAQDGVEAPPAPEPEKGSSAEIAPKPKLNLQIAKGVEELSKFISAARTNAKLAVYPIAGEGVALAYPNGDAVFVRYGAEAVSGDLFAEAAPSGLSEDSVMQQLSEVFADAHVLKITANMKDSALNFAPYDDVALMEYVAQTGSSKGFELPKIDELLGSGKAKKAVADLEDDQLADFAASCALQIAHSHAELRQELFDKKLLTVYERMEKPLILVLREMENYGAKVALPKLQELSAHFESKVAALQFRIFELAGREFNIGSPKQLGEMLFDELGLESGKKSKKSGNLSTSAAVLEDLAAAGHEIVEKVLAWRQLSKLKSTYTDALQKQIDPQTGRVHTNFIMTATNTGRLSSHNPNLQNIPIRSEEGRKIRDAFVAEAGNKLISADYSQIELRLLAHVAGIEPLIAAFKNGEDVHSTTAQQVFGLAPDAVDAEARRRAKTINFGIIYGLSAHGLATRLKISHGEAKDYIQQYFHQYPGIRAYMDETVEFCKSHGYVETLFGRRCYIKGINDKNGAVRQFSERAAINAPLQGGAADIIKLAMIELGKTDLKMSLQVHDELLFEAKEEVADATAQKVVKIMQNVAMLKVPLIVDAQVGNNWGEVH